MRVTQCLLSVCVFGEAFTREGLYCVGVLCGWGVSSVSCCGAPQEDSLSRSFFWPQFPALYKDWLCNAYRILITFPPKLSHRNHFSSPFGDSLSFHCSLQRLISPHLQLIWAWAKQVLSHAHVFDASCSVRVIQGVLHFEYCMSSVFGKPKTICFQRYLG